MARPYSHLFYFNTPTSPPSSRFSFIATNAYWLPFLNSDQDIDATLANMSATGISVVRTWAFNGKDHCRSLLFFILGKLLPRIDVTSVPQSGSFLQVIANGTTTINTGPNGLQRLDTVVKLAAKHNIYVIFVLTNNWGPTDVPTSPARRWATTLPRNFLSNNYGNHLSPTGAQSPFVNRLLL
jgi:mannan endo-1,4-beta-mannosidase